MQYNLDTDKNTLLINNYFNGQDFLFQDENTAIKDV
jgi:hypothetical protein